MWIYLLIILIYYDRYELSDGQRHNEEGEVKNIGEESAIVVKGSFSFVGDDGKTYVINYIADENGFQPSVNYWIFILYFSPIIIWFTIVKNDANNI